MNLITKTGINWEARQVRLRQGKTANSKVIGPLGPTSIEILREFYDASKTDLVFSRSGNIASKFYRILREACERAVPYGRSTSDGLVLHDARHTATTHLLESNVWSKDGLKESPRMRLRLVGRASALTSTCGDNSTIIIERCFEKRDGEHDRWSALLTGKASTALLIFVRFRLESKTALSVFLHKELDVTSCSVSLHGRNFAL